MIFDRLLVRHKLNLLVALPLVTVVGLTMLLLINEVEQVRRIGKVADQAAEARQVGVLIEEIQRARLLGVGYLDAGLVSPQELELQLVTVHDTRARLLREIGPDSGAGLARAVQGSDMVTRLGILALDHEVSSEGLIGALSAQNQILIGALELDRVTGDLASGSRLQTLGALLRANEAASQAGALLLVASTNSALQDKMISDAWVAQGIEQDEAEQFTGRALPVHRELFRQATEGVGAQRLIGASAQLEVAGFSTGDREVARDVFAAVRSQFTARQLVDVSVAQSISRTAGEASTAALTRAALLIGFGTALLGGVILLLVVVGRSVSTPLRRLTAAAGTVADAADDELADVVDDDAGPAAVRRLAALPVTSRDELGELAKAFNRVQSSTAQLLERQMTIRRNVAAMFASVGRRTNNLVGRQLALIDNLESAEDDSRTLGTLYRLDHLSTRLRRNASSLVVLSGDREPTADIGAVSLPDAIRAALGSVEEFQRVALNTLPEVNLSPGSSTDVVLIISELIENGLLYSPPHTLVEVAAWVTDDSHYALTVVDHGIGMPPGRLAEENARLRQRERLDLAPTDVLGLFVVGRLSRRYGINVTLIPTPGGGTTARVALPSSLFVENPWSGAGSGFVGKASGSPGVPASGVPAPPAASASSGVPLDTFPPPAVVPDLSSVSGVPVAAGERDQADQQGEAEKVTMLTRSTATEPDLSSGVRYRVSDIRGESPPSPVHRVTGNTSAPVGPPAALRSAASGGVSSGLVACVAPGLPDPEATRRQLEDLEIALAEVSRPSFVPPPSGAALPPPDVVPVLPPSGAALPPPDVVPVLPPSGAALPPPDVVPVLPPSGAALPPPDVVPVLPPPDVVPVLPPATGAPGGKPNATNDRLVRRVPGATLASLGTVLPDPDSSTEAPAQSQIDAGETMRAIFDVDEAIRRARAQPPRGSGHSSESDALSYRDGEESGLSSWYGPENGEGR